MWEEAVQVVRASRRPVSFSGAGLSAESGIPTFRSHGGTWSRVDPQRYASQRGFAAEPLSVIAWYNERRRAIAEAQPNPAHQSLARHPSMVHITQNVDDLLERAGSAQVIHLHGRIDRDRCNAGCGEVLRADPADPPSLRTCSRCGEAMRPDVVWFGEDLPAAEWRRAHAAVVDADLMIVAGTSAEVWPAAGLIDLAHSSRTTIVVVNTETTVAGRMADYELIGPAGEIIPALLEETSLADAPTRPPKPR